MSHLRVVNRTRGTVLASHVTVASGVWSRFRGYLGRPEPAEGEGMLLAPCNAVHTFGMAYALDVLFLDAQGTVLDMAVNLRPWRRTRRIGGARYALEVPVGTIAATDTQRGDELAWMPPRSATAPTSANHQNNADRHDGAAAAPSRRS